MFVNVHALKCMCHFTNQCLNRNHYDRDKIYIANIVVLLKFTFCHIIFTLMHFKSILILSNKI